MPTDLGFGWCYMCFYHLAEMGWLDLNQIESSPRAYVHILHFSYHTYVVDKVGNVLYLVVHSWGWYD